MCTITWLLVFVIVLSFCTGYVVLFGVLYSHMIFHTIVRVHVCTHNYIVCKERDRRWSVMDMTLIKSIYHVRERGIIILYM